MCGWKISKDTGMGISTISVASCLVKFLLECVILLFFGGIKVWLHCCSL